MLLNYFNWRTLLAIIAIGIVSGTIYYSNYLAKKIALDERQKVNIWVQAQKEKIKTNDASLLNLTNIITAENTDIPVIETNEKDEPSGNTLNLDSLQLKTKQNYLTEKLSEFKKANPPIIVVVSENPYIANKYYYGDSVLLKEVRYYPIIQLVIVALFIIITLISIAQRNKSTQNQLWAGMAKETAHQLGTPVSSLEGWIELLKEKNKDDKITIEMGKDVHRLKLVSDRFGKIGSPPQLEPSNFVKEVLNVTEYMRRRASEKVQINFNPQKSDITLMLNTQLLNWAIENLIKNALDAMEGRGQIKIEIEDQPSEIWLDISDTGKGIPSNQINKVFKPGFTTKKRGWGLGLSLTKRIVEQYHKGKIFVKWSEVGKGTTFRIVLNK